MFGFNLDLCPVLDISFDDEADNSLKGRCYGGSVEEVMANAEVFRAAMAGGGDPVLREALSRATPSRGSTRITSCRAIGRTRDELEAASWRCSGSSRGGSTA